VATHYYMDRQTTTSVTPRLEAIAGLDPGVRALLETHQVRYLTDLEGWQGKDLWRQLEGELSARQLAELRRVARLYLHQGIGAEYGNLLLRSGIRSVEELGQLPAETVLQRLDTAPLERRPTLAQVQVWVRRAHRERNTP
jgi:hypothetical protein